MPRRMDYARRLLRNGPRAGEESPPASPFVPTPIYIGERMRFVLLIACVLAVIWLAFQAPSVPRLLMLGSTLGLILSFPVRLLERWMPRSLAILTVVASVVAFVVFSLVLIVPFAIREVTSFVANVPQIVENFQLVLLDVLTEMRTRGWITQDPEQALEEIQENVLDRVQDLAQTVLTGALNTLTRSFTIAIMAFGTLFVATYLLVDIPRFRERFVRSFSPAYRTDATQLWVTIGESLSRYLAGLMVSIVIQGMMATVGLSLLGVPFAIVLGVWMSATAILPYIGAFLGAIPAVLVALTISWQMAIVVIVLYTAINQVEGNLITPRIQGSAVRVHPLVVFIAVIAGGEMAGLMGALMAVPVLAVLRVLGEFLWLRLRVRHSPDTVLVALGGRTESPDVAVAVAGEHSSPAVVVSGARSVPRVRRRVVRRRPVRRSFHRTTPDSSETAGG